MRVHARERAHPSACLRSCVHAEGDACTCERSHTCVHAKLCFSLRACSHNTVHLQACNARSARTPRCTFARGCTCTGACMHECAIQIQAHIQADIRMSGCLHTQLPAVRSTQACNFTLGFLPASTAACAQLGDSAAGCARLGVPRCSHPPRCAHTQVHACTPPLHSLPRMRGPPPPQVRAG